tara:strand:- start:1022 stop:1603 length:582 start_codon:yes stop_codon:yes gene_type:complete
MRTVTMEEMLSGNTYDMELSKIKSKIAALYKSMLVKVFKAAKPGATPEQLENFLESNELDFGDESEEFEDEVENIENIMDSLLKEDDIDPVSEKQFSKVDVESGKGLKNKTHDAPKKFNTKSLDVPKGGLFTPIDKHSLPKTSSLPIPKGSIKRKIDDDPKVSKQTLKDIWDAERKILLDLVARRNKEHGVIL